MRALAGKLVEAAVMARSRRALRAAGNASSGSLGTGSHCIARIIVPVIGGGVPAAQQFLSPLVRLVPRILTDSHSPVIGLSWLTEGEFPIARQERNRHPWHD